MWCRILFLLVAFFYYPFSASKIRYLNANNAKTANNAESSNQAPLRSSGNITAPKGQQNGSYQILQNFLEQHNISDQFTPDPESLDIYEFQTDNLNTAEVACQKTMPVIEDPTISGGISAHCLQYKPKEYSCICVLTLHKNGANVLEFVFYLK